MSLPISKAAAIYFIACHGGPADHFATYREKLVEQGYEVQIHAASGPALKKFQERSIEVKTSFSLDHLNPEEEDALAESIAKTCSNASIIITDVGHAFDRKIQKALSVHVHHIPRLAYYDNPEAFVPGGYSSTAAEVMKMAEGVLFANETLGQSKIYSAVGKELDLSSKKKFGLGYYPVEQAEKMAIKRVVENESTRSAFFNQYGIVDKGQKVLVYFGGNNEEYFSKAFPAFLSLIASASEQCTLSQHVVMIQQHPGAKAKNQEGQQLQEWSNKFGGQTELPQIVIPDFSSEQAQVLADAAFYYQTSMGPSFLIAGIPTAQIGHETYEDILVRSQLAPSITEATQFAHYINHLETSRNDSPQKESLLSSLGIKTDWFKELEEAIKVSIFTKNEVLKQAAYERLEDLMELFENSLKKFDENSESYVSIKQLNKELAALRKKPQEEAFMNEAIKEYVSLVETRCMAYSQQLEQMKKAEIERVLEAQKQARLRFLKEQQNDLENLKLRASQVELHQGHDSKKYKREK